MAASSRYSARQESIQLIERGRDSVIQAPLWLDGALVAPDSGTVTIYDASDTAVVSGAAVTVASSIAEYTVAAATTSALELGMGWRVEWTLAISTEPDDVVWSQEAALVRYRLRPAVSDADIIRRAPALDPSSSVVITTETHYQEYIDEADTEIQARLLSLGRRPWLVASPAALRQVWLFLTLALIFESVHDHRPTDGYADTAARYRQLYERAWSEARVSFDWDSDGDGDSLERVGVKPGVVWLS